MPESKLVPQSVILFNDKDSFLITDEKLAEMTSADAVDFQQEFAVLVFNNQGYSFEVDSDPKGIRIRWEKKDAG